jgi:CHAD domain-containing protein
LADEIAGAQAALAGDDAEKRIHRARQRLKRVDSLLRVLEPASPAAAASAKQALRAAAHLLAGTRDADVMVASARGLREIAGRRDNGALDRVVAELSRGAAEAHERRGPEIRAGERLKAAEAALHRLPRSIDGAALLEWGLARSYRRGYRAMVQARSSLATPDLHHWRKAVKDYWNLVRIARKRLPRSVVGSAAGFARLGDLLGLDHDHAVLADRLALSPEPDPGLMRHLSLIARERRRLEEEAFRLGERLYRRRPTKQARRFKIG